MKFFLNKIIIKFIFFIIDVSIIIACFVFAWWMRFDTLDQISKFNLTIWVSIIIWLLISFLFNIYHVPHSKNKKYFWYYYFLPQIIFVCINLLVIVFLNLDQIPRLFLLYYFLLQFFGLLISRKIRFKLINYWA